MLELPLSESIVPALTVSVVSVPVALNSSMWKVISDEFVAVMLISLLNVRSAEPNISILKSPLVSAMAVRPAIVPEASWIERSVDELYSALASNPIAPLKVAP